MKTIVMTFVKMMYGVKNIKGEIIMLFYNEKIFKRCFYHRGKYWYQNIKEIPLYFKLMNHLVKYGYDEYATWETFDWFIDTMKSILPHYKDDDRWGTPIVTDYNPYDPNLHLTDEENEELIKKNEEAWHGIIDRMLDLLDWMDEGEREEAYKAKDEFFELFSKYFYYLWD